MSALRAVGSRTLTTLWVAGLVFLALAQPSNALIESPTVALIVQAVGALLFGAAFALRGAIHQQFDRLSSFLVRSRGLRVAVRTLAVSTVVAAISEAAEVDSRRETNPVTATLRSSALPNWRKQIVANSAAPAGTSLQTAASAPHPATPAFPTTKA